MKEPVPKRHQRMTRMICIQVPDSGRIDNHILARNKGDCPCLVDYFPYEVHLIASPIGWPTRMSQLDIHFVHMGPVTPLHCLVYRLWPHTYSHVIKHDEDAEVIGSNATLPGETPQLFYCALHVACDWSH